MYIQPALELHDCKDAQDKLNTKLSKHWLALNSLFVNETKTEAMLFRTAPRLSAVNYFSITLNNNVISGFFNSLISVEFSMTALAGTSI